MHKKSVPLFCILACSQIFLLHSCVNSSEIVSTPVILVSTPTQETTDESSFFPTNTFTPDVNEPPSHDITSAMCQIGRFQDSYALSAHGEFITSPDDSWIFLTCYSGDETISHYVLHNYSDATQSWALDFPTIIENPYRWYVAAWSEDSQIFYLKYREFCESYVCMNYDGNALYAINPNTKFIEPVLPIRNDYRIYAFSFSNEAKYLAYNISGTKMLYIRDLSTEQETEIPLSDSQFWYGNLSWSPDNNYILFTGSAQDNIFEISIWLLNFENLSVRQLTPKHERIVYVPGWADNRTILLELEEAGEFVYATYDIFSETLKIVAPPQ